MDTSPIILHKQQTLPKTDTPPETQLNDSVGLFQATPKHEKSRLAARTREEIILEINTLEKRAKDGDIDAMNRLGCHLRRPGIKEDQRAEGLFMLAASADNSNAMNNLGCLYTDKNSDLYDLAKGIDWFEKSAQAGNIDAMNNLYSLYTNKKSDVYDLAKGVDWLKKAAEANSIAAMYELGTLFNDKNSDVYDLAKGNSWIQKADRLFNNENSDVYDLAKGDSWIQKADNIENATINHNKPRPFNKILDRVKNTPWVTN